MNSSVWYVAFGSALGGIARVLIGGAVQARAGGAFPVGTLVVNVTGSLLLGVLLRVALGTPSMSAEMRAMLTAGFCGGYTTFSTFSVETVALLESGDHRRAALYTLSSVALSLLATWLGFAIARVVLEARRA